MQALILLSIFRVLLVMSQDNVDDSVETVSKIRCGARCDDGSCIADSLWCNGVRDCLDGSDESRKNCHEILCREEEFQCTYGGCIPSNKTCDQNFDCVDGTDETFEMCTDTKPCPNNKFQCGYGGCIDLDKKCDGKFDC